MSRLTMGSLFDGIGGFPLAAIRSGITPVWASEIEAFPIEVTKLRFPDMVHVGDITKLNGAGREGPWSGERQHTAALDVLGECAGCFFERNPEVRGFSDRAGGDRADLLSQ